MLTPAFRFAPSPNGRLHLGHAYSALLNEREAKAAGGRFLVRIEDIDTIRCTEALARACLEDLAWLGLLWEEPVRFQSRHMGDYRDALARLDALGLLYPCTCSRRDIAEAAGPHLCDPEGQPLYPGTCRETLRSRDEPHALRLDMAKACALVHAPLAFTELGEGEIIADPSAWGDVILARRDIATSYHIAVVVDDALQDITHVVRGRDLFAATAIHRLLQELLGLPVPLYRHHRLIGDEAGRKLSKSAGDRSLASLRDAGVTPAEIRRELAF
ncbi:MAG: tRNA glutamyl-Q(34) synthetase GluQRS [Hyphomicrobiales bacterium]